MSRNSEKPKEPQENAVTGSGAEAQPEPKDDGLVKCVCVVPCVWRGYHDVGDKVYIDRRLMEGEPFFESHFKSVGTLPEGQRRQDGDDDAVGGENDVGEGENGQGELGLN